MSPAQGSILSHEDVTATNPHISPLHIVAISNLWIYDLSCNILGLKNTATIAPPDAAK